MKKKLAMSLAAVMLLLSACGGTAGQFSSDSSGQTGTAVSGVAPHGPPTEMRFSSTPPQS